MDPLPIDQHLPAALAALRDRGALVLTADPGAGKSTRIAPALLDLGPGEVLLLQPRRIAARSLAARIASERGWRLGGEVGYRVRFERVGGRETRLWVMTEGTLTRRLAEDPYLEGVGTVILDEFHERSLHTDLCLAWCAELRRTVRPDLRLCVMSATLDPTPVATFLGNAPVLAVSAPRFPVELREGKPADLRQLPERVAEAVEAEADRADSGDLLVFLPGMGEIRATAARLEHRGDLCILPLHGSLPPEAQDLALRPAGRRKVVLATNVAETSLTIPGVRTVIDSGLARVNRFDPDRGFDELGLEPISLASADQRAGRAGRTAPGRCLRLWSRLTLARMQPRTDPELARVDLAPFLLTLKALHGPDPAAFPWFEAPDRERVEVGENLLAALGACAGPRGALTPLGRRLSDLPVHPRLGRMLLLAADAGAPRLGAALAAVVGGRDLRRPRRREDPPADPGPSDLIDRLDLLERAPRTGDIDQGALFEARRSRDEFLRILGEHGETPAPADEALVARLALAAFPDRVAVRAAPEANRAAMCGGIGIEIAPDSCLHARRGHPRSLLLVAVGLQGLSSPGRSSVSARLACELDETDLALERRDRLLWDAGRQRVESTAGWWWRDLLVRVAGGAQADPETVTTFLSDQLLPQVEALVRQNEDAARILDRLAWLSATAPDLAPPRPDLELLLRGACAGCRSRDEVMAKPWGDWLSGTIGHAGMRALDEHAPDRLLVPSGSRIRLDYGEPGRPPVLAVRVQELFGLAATPTIAGGRIRVLLHLLAPNYRPEQVTDDLAGFWIRTWPQVRKDLRGRYPKHPWPDDPLNAIPVAKGRPRN